MVLKVLRFLSLLLVALTLGLTFCHVMEIAGKLRPSGAEWLTVQHNPYVAFGPALGAWIEVGAIVLTWSVAFLVRRRRPAAWWTSGVQRLGGRRHAGPVAAGPSAAAGARGAAYQHAGPTSSR